MIFTMCNRLPDLVPSSWALRCCRACTKLGIHRLLVKSAAATRHRAEPSPHVDPINDQIGIIQVSRYPPVIKQGNGK